MTENEIKNTKKWFEDFIETYALSNQETIEFKKAVACLEEIQQYRAIGTVEEVKSIVNIGKWGYRKGYAKAIDEFAENLKRKILEEIYDVSDRQKNYEVGSDMSMTCSHIMGTLRDVYHRIVDEIAEQMKAGGIDG